PVHRDPALDLRTHQQQPLGQRCVGRGAHDVHRDARDVATAARRPVDDTETAPGQPRVDAEHPHPPPRPVGRVTAANSRTTGGYRCPLGRPRAPRRTPTPTSGGRRPRRPPRGPGSRASRYTMACEPPESRADDIGGSHAAPSRLAGGWSLTGERGDGTVEPAVHLAAG